VRRETYKRVSIDLEPVLLRQLRSKAARTRRTVSEIVNDAIRALVSEDEQDLHAFEHRARESTMSYAALLKNLKAKG
jgi:metal-responsive CopG/Arc/MetJ family transcriptional regulator